MVTCGTVDQMTWRALTLRTSAASCPSSASKWVGRQTEYWSLRQVVIPGGAPHHLEPGHAPERVVRAEHDHQGFDAVGVLAAQIGRGAEWGQRLRAPGHRREHVHGGALPVVLDDLPDQVVLGRLELCLAARPGALERVAHVPAVDGEVVVDPGHVREAGAGTALPVVLHAIHEL